MAKSLYTSCNQKGRKKLTKTLDKIDAKQQKALKSICKEKEHGVQTNPKDRYSRVSQVLSCLDSTGRTSDGFEY